MLDNFPHIKAYWVTLTPDLAQVALRFGATIWMEPLLKNASFTVRARPPNGE
jgi:Thiamine biosynthesis enzyme ThiH and related uncharacterized enzymes